VQRCGFGPRLRDHPVGELAAMRKRRPKQDPQVGENQKSDEILRGFARAVNQAEETSDRKRKRECEHRGRHGGENERAAAEHADADAGDDQVVASGRVKEKNRGGSPDRAKRARVDGRFCHERAARALRQRPGAAA